MRHLLRMLLLGLGLLGLAACQPAPRPAALGARPLRARFFALLYAGDSIYAQKRGYNSFARALAYYDSAQALAGRGQDTLLLAEAVFARARVYDAWNQEPTKTIKYFEQATALFRTLPAQRRRYYYAWSLVAHAYDKVPDSLRAVRTLRALRASLAPLPPDSLRQLPFTVEMALSATQVHAYGLADTLLRQLTRRAWIANDPATYDYLNHYFLVQSRLDVYYRRRLPSLFLDSLDWQYDRARNVMDRAYYSDNLARLSAAAGRYPAAYAYLSQNKALQDSLQNSRALPVLRRALVASEQRAARQQQGYDAGRRRARQVAIWGLSAALAVITLLSFYLFRQGRRARGQSQRLAVVNHALDDKVAQVELLNKEMQHRVKNNLHMIFSLLHMQERRTDNEEVIAQLQAARLRVESIAALHNQLQANPEVLDLGDYLKGLVLSAVNCLANDKQVVTHIQTHALRLPTNSYFALSLILNEWVTNSLKHAGNADNRTEVNVLVHSRPGEVCIEYFDNGPAPGRPAGETGPSGLGTQIIGLLSQQLGATLRTRPHNPFHYELCLPHGA